MIEMDDRSVRVHSWLGWKCCRKCLWVGCTRKQQWCCKKEGRSLEDFRVVDWYYGEAVVSGSKLRDSD